MYKILSDYFSSNFYVLENKVIGHIILTFKKPWFEKETINRLVQISKFWKVFRAWLCDVWFFMWVCRGSNPAVGLYLIPLTVLWVDSIPRWNMFVSWESSIVDRRCWKLLCWKAIYHTVVINSQSGTPLSKLLLCGNE